jgi:hypothetical protein
MKRSAPSPEDNCDQAKDEKKDENPPLTMMLRSRSRLAYPAMITSKISV